MISASLRFLPAGRGTVALAALLLSFGLGCKEGTARVPAAAKKPTTPAPCLAPETPYTTQLQGALSEFQDAMTIASATSRIALPAQVARLQEVRRKLEAAQPPTCAATAHAKLVAAMNEEIESFLRFLTLDAKTLELMNYMDDYDKAAVLHRGHADGDFFLALRELARLKEQHTGVPPVPIQAQGEQAAEDAAIAAAKRRQAEEAAARERARLAAVYVRTLEELTGPMDAEARKRAFAEGLKAARELRPARKPGVYYTQPDYRPVTTFSPTPAR